MGLLSVWEQVKKDFAAGVVTELKTGSISDAYSTAIKNLIKTDTGLTPALKDVDSALSKKERKTAMTALTKLHMVIEKNRKPIDDVIVLGNKIAMEQDVIVRKTKDKVDNMKLNMLNDLVETIGTYKKAILELETKAAEAIENLQEEKSPEGKKIAIISLEGDMKGAVEKYKKDMKPFEANEKVHKILTTIEGLAKSMQAYSKAAARTEVKNALTHLEAFFKGIDTLKTARTKVSAAKPAVPPGYLLAIDTLVNALSVIRQQRGNVSLLNLKKLEAEGAS